MASAGAGQSAPSPARVCTIAGSDSGGGAGIQADLKTIHGLGAYGLSVVTALTAQNTVGVQGVHVVPPDFVRRQFESIRSDIRIDAIKIGMLAQDDIVREVGRLITAPYNDGVPIVLDPVMVSTSRSMLLHDDAVMALIDDVFPYTTVVTPNVDEARAILERKSEVKASAEADDASQPLLGTPTLVAGRDDEDDLLKLGTRLKDAERIANLGPGTCLLKGGHAPVLQDTFNHFYGVARCQRVQSGNINNSKICATTQSYSMWESSTRPHPNAPNGYVYQLGSIGVVRMDADDSLVLDRYRRRNIDDREQAQTSRRVVVDILYQRQPDTGQNKWTLFVSRHSQSTSTHGTGCTLSSALATFLAQGFPLRAACGLAITYVAQGIPRGIDDLGSGAGPLDHGLSTDLRPHLRRALPPPAYPQEHAPLSHALLGGDTSLWRRYTRHPFLRRLLNATDDSDAPFWEHFTYFLKQDYLFLQHYARMFALAAAATAASSSSSMNAREEMESFSRTAAVCMLECEKHLTICEANGIARHTLTHDTPESAAVVAYTRFVLDIGHGGGGAGVLPMLVAMAPCALGYAEIGLWLAAERRAQRQASGEPESYANLYANKAQQDVASNALRHRIAYDAWIDTYSGNEFQNSVADSITLMERKAQEDPPTAAKLAALKRIWSAAVKLEIGMWDEAVDPSTRRPILDPV